MALGLDDLARYSPWPARLLGAQAWPQKRRTLEDVEREFGKEKWGTLLERGGRESLSLDAVESWANPSGSPILALVDGNWTLAAAGELRARYVEFVARALSRVPRPSALVELGCGYGGLLLRIARTPAMSGLPLFAADYAESGVELVRRLAKAENLSVETSTCDLGASPITNLRPPAGCLVYTSYAAHYLARVDDRFLDAITLLRPTAVVHCEPVYEHCDEGSLLGLMRKRYIEINDYNTNLLTVLRAAASQNRVEIIEASGPSFGVNPLLSASTLIWRPR